MNAKCKCHHVYKSGEPEEDAVYLQGVGCATAVDAMTDVGDVRGAPRRAVECPVVGLGLYGAYVDRCVHPTRAPRFSYRISESKGEMLKMFRLIQKLNV